MALLSRLPLSRLPRRPGWLRLPGRLSPPPLRLPHLRLLHLRLPRLRLGGLLAQARRFRGWLATWIPKSPLARAACLVLAIVTLGALAVEASKSSLLDVDHIVVTGGAEVPAEVVLAATGVQTGDALFGVDTARVEERLEALSWVRTAEVSRDYPSKLKVTLTERTAAAYLARPEGGFALLDGEARVLADRPERPAGLPELMGVGTPPATGAFLDSAAPVLAAVAALPPDLRSQVSQSALVEGTVNLMVAGREVRFGAPDQLDGKAATLVALLGQIGNRPLAYIDVRVPSAPVVAPLPPAGAPAAPAGPTAPAPSGGSPGPRD